MGKVLFANQSGHFPWCMKDEVISGLGIRYIPLLEAMEHYWRIRKFKVFAEPATIVVQYGNDEFGAVAIDTINMFGGEFIVSRGNENDPAFRIPNKEEDLVCGRSNSNKKYDETLFSFSFFGTSTTIFPELEPFGFPPITRQVSTAASARDEFFFDNNYRFNKQNGQIANQTRIGETSETILPPPLIRAIGTITWQFSKNFTIGPLVYYSQIIKVDELTYPIISKTGSFNIRIIPYEWWSYGGTWNTSTGQPL